MSKKDEIVMKDVTDLLNQIIIRLKLNDVPNPEVDQRYENDGHSNIPVEFNNAHSSKTPDRLMFIKTVVEGMLKELTFKGDHLPHDIEKMARAYYSSFCNG